MEDMSNLEEISEKYALCDGSIHSIKMQYPMFSEALYQEAVVEVVLKVRKKEKRKQAPILLILTFTDIKEVSIIEDYLSGSDYSDIKFINEGACYYLSIDPYDDTQQVHKDDNLIIRAKTFKYYEKHM